MEVSIWTPSPPSKTNRRESASEFTSVSTLAGLIGTFLVHALALQGVLHGSRTNEVKLPEVQTGGSRLIHPESVLSQNLVIIEVPAVRAIPHALTSGLVIPGPIVKSAIATITSAEPPKDVDIPSDRSEGQGSVSAADSADSAEIEHLSGIYTGQIHARIERGWQRPRTAVNIIQDGSSDTFGEEPFKCRVQILQDGIGNIEDIFLENCNGSAAWRRSLVVAIQQASPLPAPPDPLVFSRTITMDFVGYSYSRGANEEEYEIARDFVPEDYR